MKVMVLSGQFGLGHQMAARAIGEEVKKLDDTAEVKEVDLFAYFFPRLSRPIFWLFQMMVKHCHGIYNFMYKVSGKMEVDVKPTGFRIYKKLNTLFEKEKPDIIVCTHPVCAKSVASYIKKTGDNIPLVTCITDISMHPEWITPQTTAYLAPTREVKESLVDRGADRDNVFVTGIPVRQQFLIKREPNTAKTPRKILIMGGGLGIIPDVESLMKMLHELPGVSVTIVAGKNHKAFEEWKNRYPDVNVLGYVDSISKLMMESDLVISKAGGITLFELIHCGVPIFVIHPFLEQEVNNAQYAEDRGVAKVVWNRSENFIPVLREYLTNGDEWRAARDNMRNLKEEITDIDISEAMKLVMERMSA